MNKALIVLSLLVPALLVVSFPASGQVREMTLSLGVGGGDFHDCFAAGIFGGQSLAPFLQAEGEIYYYRQPGEPSATPGLAITSTAIDMNFSLLLQPDPTFRKVVPFAIVTAGMLYESETWEWDVTRVRAYHSYTRLDFGLGFGVKIMIAQRSGIRVDFRWLRVSGRKYQVPRFTIGYMFRV